MIVCVVVVFVVCVSVCLCVVYNLRVLLLLQTTLPMSFVSVTCKPGVGWHLGKLVDVEMCIKTPMPIVFYAGPHTGSILMHKISGKALVVSHFLSGSSLLLLTEWHIQYVLWDAASVCCILVSH